MAFYMAWFHKKTHIKVIVSQLMDVDGCYIYVYIYIYSSEKPISHPISHPIFFRSKTPPARSFGDGSHQCQAATSSTHRIPRRPEALNAMCCEAGRLKECFVVF